MAGGGGGGGGTQRVINEAPIYQAPWGIERAEQLYQRGQPVVPFAPQTEQALGLQQQRALSGSPVTGAAQDYVTRSLQGGFLGSNPYLDQTFNRAALQTQNQLASEFARSGRSVDASEGLRSQQLNDLANQIYGGAYGQERQLMQGTLPFAQGLANQDYIDIGQLRGVGSEVENLAGQYANAPGANFDAYLGRVQGGGQPASQTTNIDQSRNRGAGALGGALIGNMLFPGLGGIIGGGLLGGIF